MGKTSAKVCKQQIATELRRWVTKSKQIRINSHISYGKIKANLSALALMTSKEDLRAMTREIGNF
jgi:prophage antirepressor-like protein